MSLLKRRSILSLAALPMLAACQRSPATGPRARTLRFWAMGGEAEHVGTLLPAFERERPGLKVVVDQIPFTTAHEKLLTSFAGDATPDVTQLGNTWIPELVALNALEPLQSRIDQTGSIRAADYFDGIWATNLVDGVLFGVPWYVDTRLLFYRSDLLLAAGIARAPQNWAEWRDAMRAVTDRGGPMHYGALLPLNEPDPLFSLSLQQGPVLADDDTRGAFAQPPFRRALDFYAGLFHDGLAPAMTATQISNVYDEFARGLFTFYVSGPWNIGEFRHRLPLDRQKDWATAVLPGPDGPGVSSAGGASLVMFKGSARKEAAWELIMYLSEPATMQRFHALTGNLPSRRSAWRSHELADDVPSQAFAAQLEHVRPAPKIPEWERIFQEMQATAERVVQNRQGAQEACVQLDAWVDQLLEKRRWLRTRAASRA